MADQSEGAPPLSVYGYITIGTFFRPDPPAFRRVSYDSRLADVLTTSQRRELDSLVLCGLFRDAQMFFGRNEEGLLIQISTIVPERDTGVESPFVVLKRYPLDALSELGPARCAREALRLLAEHEVDEGVALVGGSELYRPFDPHRKEAA